MAPPGGNRSPGEGAGICPELSIPPFRCCRCSCRGAAPEGPPGSPRGSGPLNRRIIPSPPPPPPPPPLHIPPHLQHPGAGSTSRELIRPRGDSAVAADRSPQPRPLVRVAPFSSTYQLCSRCARRSSRPRELPDELLGGWRKNLHAEPRGARNLPAPRQRAYCLPRSCSHGAGAAVCVRAVDQDMSGKPGTLARGRLSATSDHSSASARPPVPTISIGATSASENRSPAPGPRLGARLPSSDERAAVTSAIGSVTSRRSAAKSVGYHSSVSMIPCSRPRRRASPCAAARDLIVRLICRRRRRGTLQQPATTGHRGGAELHEREHSPRDQSSEATGKRSNSRSCTLAVGEVHLRDCPAWRAW